MVHRISLFVLLGFVAAGCDTCCLSEVDCFETTLIRVRSASGAPVSDFAVTVLGVTYRCGSFEESMDAASESSSDAGADDAGAGFTRYREMHWCYKGSVKIETRIEQGTELRIHTDEGETVATADVVEGGMSDSACECPPADQVTVTVQ